MLNLNHLLRGIGGGSSGEGKSKTGILAIRMSLRDFAGGPVVKNPPSSAGDLGLIPGRGTKIPHAAGQLSLRRNY